MKAFHYFKYGIGHFYAPKGSGKSILFRSLLVNYNDLNDLGRYTSLIFFDMRLLNELLHFHYYLNRILVFLKIFFYSKF